MRLIDRGRSDLARSSVMARIIVPVVLLGCLAMLVAVLLRNATPVSSSSDAENAGNLSSDWTLTQKPAVLFIGDSYTEGTGSNSPPESGYSCLTAAALGWTCLLDAQGATGYLNNGHLLSRDNAPFAARLAADAKTFRPDVVVVDGGRNDGSLPIGQVAAGVKSYLERLHATFPQARLVLISPAYMFSTSGNYSFSVQLTDRLRKLGRPYDAVVVDPLGEKWFAGTDPKTLVEKDGIHPNQKGHELMAARLTADLRKAGLDRLEAPARSF